ncbi:hypothetical protein PK69_13085 [Xanthomonas phaseoli pv. phaseoli]|uniref:Xsa-invasion protein n=1 Tax=Xanthomonas campestris pv. phaseoli TaxID=317013 RepID=A0AB34QHH7_XANCH|nr:MULTISPECIES: IpaC/SipC family type III secretion system effector [Xanthomonas]ATS23137.2 hypothetical protein XppCFBP412P_18275 [Xanthomonas phaseoli pv. phaseoli]ATS26034.2 hypothetical protein XppCFBP6164P_11215 [Xanthomonas phaseoli pv. phaseoli]ATS30472.2 hypothetical protein XppCFBP6546P_12475 [Xanthomonas phaseoli pv. phaseoli]ATS34293.2 hypothetical protein XppCFBP6982P_10680 [Xanthomonas phaseoli pv. phaseoli]AZU15304.1 hypothetical protein AC609_22125 [Xanthomonas phaseoli pv. pha
MTINIGSEGANRLEFYRIETAQTRAADATAAAALQGAALDQPARVLAQMPALDATTTASAGATTAQTVPQLMTPRTGAEQLFAPAEMASIAQPLVNGTDVIGNAFIGVLAESATKEAGASDDRPSGFLMDDAKIDVLLMMSAEWQKAQIADRQLQSEMTTIASKAAIMQSDSQIAAGNDALASAVGASALNVGMQVTGTVVRVRALNKEHASLKVNSQNAQDSHERDSLINRATRSAEAVRASEVDTITVESGANRHTLRLEEDRVRAPANHLSRMGETAMASESRAADLSGQHSLNMRTWGRDYAKADLWRTGGDVSAKMVDGVGQMEQSNEHAHQTVDQNQQEVARSDASLHEESARQSRAIAQEMHNITSQLINNINSVAAQVAGNLRA